MDNKKVAQELLMVAKELTSGYGVEKILMMKGDKPIFIARVQVSSITAGNFGKLTSLFRKAQKIGRNEIESDLKPLVGSDMEELQSFMGKDAFNAENDLMYALISYTSDSLTREDAESIGYRLRRR